jgi:hypothetical protein
LVLACISVIKTLVFFACQVAFDVDMSGHPPVLSVSSLKNCEAVGFFHRAAGFAAECRFDRPLPVPRRAIPVAGRVPGSPVGMGLRFLVFRGKEFYTARQSGREPMAGFFGGPPAPSSTALVTRTRCF